MRSASSSPGASQRAGGPPPAAATRSSAGDGPLPRGSAKPITSMSSPPSVQRCPWVSAQVSSPEASRATGTWPRSESSASRLPSPAGERLVVADLGRLDPAGRVAQLEGGTGGPRHAVGELVHGQRDQPGLAEAGERLPALGDDVGAALPREEAAGQVGQQRHQEGEVHHRRGVGRAAPAARPASGW